MNSREAKMFARIREIGGWNFVDPKDFNSDKDDDTMRGILIDPEKQTVTDVDVGIGDFDTLYKIMDCQQIECVGWRNNDVWVDEEAGFGGPQHRFAMNGLPYVLVGKAVILSCDPETGDMKECSLSADEVSVQIAWV